MCRQSDDSIEKRLAIRQTTVKTIKSNSWFVSVKKLLWKYELGEIEDLLSDPPTKLKWKLLVSKTLNCYWKKHFTDQLDLYKTLKDINLQEYKPGKLHTLLQLKTVTWTFRGQIKNVVGDTKTTTLEFTLPTTSI